MRLFGRFLPCLLLLAVTGLWSGEQAMQTWNTGLRLYAEGQFEDALASFETLLPESDHWRIHYNIGNCLFRLERFLEAKIAYARAWKTAPGQRSVRKNLMIVNARLGLEDELLKQPFLEKAVARLDSLLPPQTGAVLLIVFLFLFNLALFFWIRQRLVRLARYALVLFLLLAIVSAVSVFHFRSMVDRDDLAVVRGTDASLFSGPGEHHTALFSLPRGLIVHVRERGDQWLRVRAGRDVAGWIRPELLIVL